MKPVSPSPADKAIPSPRKGNIFLYRFRHDLTKNNYLYNVFLLKVKIMKKILSLALAAVLTSTACKDNTPNRFDGVIVDASMNTVTVKALTGDDTHTFSLEEADKTDANGLLIGNLISVTYQGKMSEVTPGDPGRHGRNLCESHRQMDHARSDRFDEADGSRTANRR